MKIWTQDNLNFMDKNGLVPTYGNVKGKKQTGAKNCL